MAISDAVVGNLTTIYLVVKATVKAYALATGRSFSAACVIFLSTAVVASVLIASLAWDVSRKAAQTLMKAAPSTTKLEATGYSGTEKSPASQVRFSHPRHH